MYFSFQTCCSIWKAEVPEAILGQISHFLLPLYKLGESGEVSQSELNDSQSSALRVDVIYFRHVAPFWNQSASKVTGGRKSRPYVGVFDLL